MYDHKKVEKKWQDVWKKEKLYSPDLSKTSKKDKFYNLWMFPYPSAEGLHAGHAFASTGSDVYGRFMRMNGKIVFQPIGYDSFGIHSENYAIKINQNPHEVVKRTTKHYEEQMRSLGHGYDWTRTVTTSSPDYYKWTQWLFIEMYKQGLAYRKKAEVNFCPSCKTVLADEQVMTPKQAGKEPKDKDGNAVADSEDLKVCERCGTISEKKELDQWFFKITDYADRLLSGLETIDWSNRVVTAQREWIGKKVGINIHYDIVGYDRKVEVFTTAPVNFGMTFLVLSPAHPLVSDILSGEYKESKEYIKEIEDYVKKYNLEKKNVSRKEVKEKTGVQTGLFVLNPINNTKIPVWISDFVVEGVGTGAVQGCPGHDLNDFEFAKKYNLPIIRVIVGKDGDKSEIVDKKQVVEHGMEGKFINSDFLNGLDFELGLQKTMDWFESKGFGKRSSHCHLRDWLVSRQRYWGAPIPMIWCDKCEWVPDENLPVLLPDIDDYKPEGNGRGPLANHEEFWKVNCPKCGAMARRETDVMDTFVDSSWYFLRYPSVGDDNQAINPEISKEFLPVDLYFGGAEHSVLHLMYARFVNMVLKDRGHLDHDEPFPKFFAHGLMIKDGAKMSKSRGNVVNPDTYVEKFGADTLRLYVMFMGPMDGYPDFRDSGIEGMQRFLRRVMNLFGTEKQAGYQDITNNELDSTAHLTIKGVTEDIKQFKYNTAIAKIMKYVNELTEEVNTFKTISTFHLETLTKLLAPFAPHFTEEIWREVLKNKSSIHTSEWPSYDEKYLESDMLKIAVSINGKSRSQIIVPATSSEDYIKKVAKEDPKVSKWLESAVIKKEIYIKGKLINLVI